VAKPTFSQDKRKNESVMDLAEPQTVAARVVEVLRPHVTKILVVLAGVILVVVGLAVYTTLQHRKAGEATYELGRLFAVVGARVDEAGPQIDLVDPTLDLTQPAPADYKTFSDRTAAALELSQKLDLGSSALANDAELVLAALLYDAGKHDEAIAAYRKFLEAAQDAFLSGQAREGIGYALEAKALAQTDATARNSGLDEALAAFRQIASGEKQPLYPVALYHQARLTALKGDRPAAIDLFKKALENGAPPRLSDEINNRLALLEGK
jgi:tetratricopeptide (TPR) repeat protein